MEQPWLRLPRVTLPVVLHDADPAGRRPLDTLFDLPDGSAFAVARIDPADGRLHTLRWRDTGALGFYPASTIKWITAALAVAWMDNHQLVPEDVLCLGPAAAAGTPGVSGGAEPSDPPRTLRDLVLDMLVLSDNDAFNTLQEAVGFAETHAVLQGFGVRHGLIRRHFTRPHWNHSRPVRVYRRGMVVCEIPARPAVALPLSTDRRPAPLGNPEANYFTSDDLLRVAAATLLGPTRDARYFDLFTQGLAWTNQCRVRQGLARLTGRLPHHPAFVVLNKPGWWPPDGANSELCYIYDVSQSEHYLLAVYVQGSQKEARTAMANAAETFFASRHLRQLDL